MPKPAKEPEDILPMLAFIVMTTVEALEKAYGMEVFEAIKTVQPGYAFGSVYTSLERLGWQGYLETELGDPEPVRGGRAKKYYKLSEAGKKVLAVTRKTIADAGRVAKPVLVLTPALALGGKGKRLG